MALALGVRWSGEFFDAAGLAPSEYWTKINGSHDVLDEVNALVTGDLGAEVAGLLGPKYTYLVEPSADLPTERFVDSRKIVLGPEVSAASELLLGAALQQVVATEGDEHRVVLEQETWAAAALAQRGSDPMSELMGLEPVQGIVLEGDEQYQRSLVDAVAGAIIESRVFATPRELWIGDRLFEIAQVEVTTQDSMQTVI
ncbi:MAG: hypothetical protein KIH63_003325 [Candidatus Saccharibacteria bacterium]|nr:hypothetical protein [Candidatus Saccharibacteria bacterium]